jgi:hypothetical protein
MTHPLCQIGLCRCFTRRRMQGLKSRAFRRELFELKFFRQKSKRLTILLTNLNLSSFHNFHESLND